VEGHLCSNIFFALQAQIVSLDEFAMPSEVGRERISPQKKSHVVWFLEGHGLM